MWTNLVNLWKKTCDRSDLKIKCFAGNKLYSYPYPRKSIIGDTTPNTDVSQNILSHDTADTNFSRNMVALSYAKRKVISLKIILYVKVKR